MNLNLPFISITSIVCLISFAIFNFLNKQKQDFSSKRVILVSLLFVLIHGVSVLVVFIESNFPIVIYICLQLLAIITGTFFYKTVLKTSFKKFNFPVLSTILLFTLVLFFSSLLFTFIFDIFNNSGLGWYYSTAFFAFVIPFLFYKTFEAIVTIPLAIYKVWYYPEDSPEIDLDDLDLNKVKVVELEFLKNLGETSTTNFKAKAPEELRFGDWFCMFIQNYNEKYEDNPIVIKDKNQTNYGWVFYIKPGFFGSKKFVDYDFTITQNNLNENMVVVCRRVENK